MRTVSSRAIAFIALSLIVGCGLENSVVGGRCRDGMVLSGGTCVSPVDVTLITPTTPPVPTTDSTPIPPPTSVPEPVPPFPTVFVPEPPLAIIEPPTELQCVAPLVACHGVCIAVDGDAANCGACGKICPSNICINGECQGATPGDVVLVGHDYTNAFAGSAQAKVLINTLTIPTTDPIRILSFEDGADAAAVAQMRYLATASIKDRKVKFTRAASASSLASASLGKNYDVVIINDASAVNPVTTGASWASPLGTFAAKGGVVLAIDLGTSAMPQLLSSAGLLTVGSHTKLPEETHLMVTGAADVVGAQVLSPYAAFGPPVSFQGVPAPSPDFNWVVRVTLDDETPGDPVVVHRIVR
ncbi:MAG TPA: hypothetical protein VLT33_04590 [Labilithrix sp.]|nr:hypothetical protein [Labilithrix sp.]